MEREWKEYKRSLNSERNRKRDEESDRQSGGGEDRQEMKGSKKGWVRLSDQLH